MKTNTLFDYFPPASPNSQEPRNLRSFEGERYLSNSPTGGLKVIVVILRATFTLTIPLVAFQALLGVALP
jgi:hypothetical protein